MTRTLTPVFPNITRSSSPLVGLAIGLFLWSTSTGCASEARSQPEVDQREVFPIATARTEDSVVERKYVAEVRAVRYAEVRTRVDGIIDQTLVDEGQAVKTGASLFTINASDLKQSVAAAKAAVVGAEAELRASELEFESTRLLHDKDVVSKAELELSRARVEALQAKVSEWRATLGRAEVELGYARIRAPFDGVVNRLIHKAGSAVTESTLLTTIADTSEVHAYFRLTEREYLEFVAREGAERPREVWLELVDGSMHPEPGILDAVENEVDQDTGSIALRARFKNPAGVIKHGSGGKVVLRQQLPNALLVPQKATFETQGDVFVFTVDQDNVARARKIEPKLRLGEDFVIDAGLTADERFVLEGAQKLRDGVKIETALPSPVSEG